MPPDCIPCRGQPRSPTLPCVWQSSLSNMFRLSSNLHLRQTILLKAREATQDNSLEFKAPEEYLLSEEWSKISDDVGRRQLLTSANLLFLPSRCAKLLGEGGLLCRRKNRVAALVGPTRTGKSEFSEMRLPEMLKLEDGRQRNVSVVNGNFVSVKFAHLTTGLDRIELLFRLFAKGLELKDPGDDIHAFVKQNTHVLVIDELFKLVVGLSEEEARNFVSGLFALFDNGLTGDEVGCVLLFADTGYFATAVLFALQAYGGNEVGPETCCVIRVDELHADRAGATTDTNILCAAAMSVCGFSHTEIQAFVKLDVPYSIRRLFLANRIMDEGNVEMAVRNVVRDQLARDVDFIIQDLKDIRAVLSDESWGHFWNWLVYVRDVSDGLGRGAESIETLPYPYRRVANPLNVVCSPAMGFSLSDLLNAILGTCQKPRNPEDLEEVLSLLPLPAAERLTKIRDNIRNLSEITTEENEKIRRDLGADALPLFSATACVLASAPTWLPVLDIKGYCKVGNDFANSIPLSSGKLRKLRPFGRQVAPVPPWARPKGRTVSGFHSEGSRVKDQKHGPGTVTQVTPLPSSMVRSLVPAFETTVQFRSGKVTYIDPLSSCLGMTCSEWASLISANPIILLYTLRNGMQHPGEADLGMRTLSRLYLSEKSQPTASAQLQPWTKSAAQQYESVHGEVDFDPQALLMCGSAFLFLAAPRDAPAAAGTTQPANPPGARSRGQSAQGRGRGGRGGRARGRGRGGRAT